ncbi:MAG: hypothetical protein K5922_03145 [Clostridiales bacterium]|nr:hypothetical protein [Clostridiales bacterium]
MCYIDVTKEVKLMGPESYEGETKPMGRPTKGLLPMTLERKIRMDPEMDALLQEKCRRLGCTIADGIREGVKLFIRQRY